MRYSSACGSAAEEHQAADISVYAVTTQVSVARLS